MDQFDEKCQLIFQAFDFDLTDEITPDEMVPTKLNSRSDVASHVYMFGDSVGSLTPSLTLKLDYLAVELSQSYSRHDRERERPQRHRLRGADFRGVQEGRSRPSRVHHPV